MKTAINKDWLIKSQPFWKNNDLFASKNCTFSRNWNNLLRIANHTIWKTALVDWILTIPIIWFWYLISCIWGSPFVMDRFMYWLQCSTCLSEPLALSLLLLNTCGKLSHSSTKLIQLGRTTPIDAYSSNKAQYFRAIFILFPKKLVPFFFSTTFLKKTKVSS